MAAKVAEKQPSHPLVISYTNGSFRIDYKAG